MNSNDPNLYRGQLLTRMRLFRSLNYMDVARLLNWEIPDVREYEWRRQLPLSRIQEVADKLNFPLEALTDHKYGDPKWEEWKTNNVHTAYHDGLRVLAYVSDIGDELRSFAKKAKLSPNRLVNLFSVVDIPKKELEQITEAIGVGGLTRFYRVEVPYFQIRVGTEDNPIGEKLQLVRKAAYTEYEMKHWIGIDTDLLRELEKAVTLPICWPLLLSNVFGVSLAQLVSKTAS